MTPPPPLTLPAPTRAIVMASAGTGKTHTLSSRLLHTLLERGPGADPAGILATTFTRKAAGEILQRALSRLLEASRDAGRLEGLRRETGLALTAEACTAAAAALARRMDRVRIMTIDSFMGRLARAAALELEAPPSWGIAEDIDLDAMRRQAIDHALAAMEPQTLGEILRGAARKPFSRAIHAGVARLVRVGHDAFLLAGSDPRAWGVIAPEGEPLAPSDLDRAIRDLERAPVPATKGGQPNQTFAKAVGAVVGAARAEDWQSILAKGLGQRVLTTGEYSGKPIPDALAAALAPIIHHARWQYLSRLRDRNTAAAALLAAYDRALRALRRDRALLAFDDVPRLLVEADVGARLTELWYRLDAGLDAMLLDEAQDTSLIQFRLLHPILAELLSGGERPVLIVGDVKQSLYAWRSAEAMLLPHIASAWPVLQQRSLSRSFRSSQVVLDAVNDTFGSLGGRPALQARTGASGAARSFQDLFLPQHAADHRPPPPGLMVLRTHPVDPESDPQRPKSDLIAGVVGAAGELLAQAGGRAPSVGILLRTNKPIRSLVAALREAGIDASPEGGSPLADDPVVAVLLSVLHLADHPTDRLAAYHIATSPLAPAIGWAGVPSPGRARRWAARVRRRLYTRGYAWVLERLLARLGPAIPPPSVERIDQLLDLARAFDQRASLRPAEFLAIVGMRRIARATPAPVRVMTIHAAKGLEFDAVILPELDRIWGSDGHGALLRRPGPIDIADAASLSVSRDLGVAHPLLQTMLDQRDGRETFEQLCTLYVAMTRARRALVMLIDPFGPPKKSGDAPAPRASTVVREALAPACEEAGPDSEVGQRRTEQAWFEGLPTGEARAPGPAQALPALRPARRGPVRLAPASPGSLRRAPVVSPSSLEGGGIVDLAARLGLAPGGAADVGTIAHAMLASIAWLEDGIPAAESLRAAGAGVRGARPDTLDQALAIVVQFLASPAAATLRRDWHRAPGAKTGARVEPAPRREWPFLLAQEGQESRLLSGIIDRLVILRDDQGRPVGADILDFKTDRVEGTDEQALAGRVEHYRPQLEAYRGAVAALFGLPPGSVRAGLVFVSMGRAVMLDEAAPGGPVGG